MKCEAIRVSLGAKYLLTPTSLSYLLQEIIMSDYKDQKELKMAMNGRMGLMTGGIILLVTAVSSTLMYGINLF